MNKQLINFIWLNKLFLDEHIKTISGKTITVIATGIPYQYHSDICANINNYTSLSLIPSVVSTSPHPDFSNATIQIENIILKGSVKTDLHNEDWYEQQTVNNKNFTNVILHLVLECSDAVIQQENEIITAKLEIPEYINETFSRLAFGCLDTFAELEQAYQENFLSRLASERIGLKSQEIINLYHELDNNWEQTAIVSLCRNITQGSDKTYYETLAKHIPYQLFISLSGDILSLEALLLGQAGILNNSTSNNNNNNNNQSFCHNPDDYHEILKQTYKQIQNNHKLGTQLIEKTKQYGRPQEYTTLQLIKLASILNKTPALFNEIITANNYEKLRTIFDTPLSDYWQNHLSLDNISRGITKISSSKIDLILINCVVPLISAYGIITNKDQYRELAEEVMQKIPAETNRLTKEFVDKGYYPKNAFYSQSIIQLKKLYCAKAKCLDCPIGKHIMLNAYKKYNAQYKTVAELSPKKSRTD